MNWWKHHNSFLMISAGLIFYLVPNIIFSQDGPLSGVRIPLEIYDNGQVKVQVMADSVSRKKKGYIFATGVRIEIFTEDGNVEGVITAESCTVDLGKEIITSSKKVFYDRDGLHISGTGFEFQGTNKLFKIFSRTRVVFQRPSFEGIGNPPVVLE